MLFEAFLVVGFIALSLAGLIAVRRRVALEQLQEQHDVAAACFAVLGSLYGIVLAFVLVSSWERFEAARQDVQREVDALSDVYRHTQALPEPTRANLQQLILAYAHSVIDSEWPAMATGERSPETQRIFGAMWATLLATPASDQVAVFQNTLSRMDDFSDARRGRLRYIRVGMPTVVWVFLVAAGIITVAFSYFFGLRLLVPQMLMTAALAGTMAFALVLIAELQQPFGGNVSVPPTDFVDALKLLKASTGASSPWNHADGTGGGTFPPPQNRGPLARSERRSGL